MDDNYGYTPRPTDFDPTAMDDIFSQPTEDYPRQPPYTPPAPLARYNPIGDLPTIKRAPTRVRPPSVPQRVVVRDGRDGMALASLLLGIISGAISLIPLCGIVALLPAMIGILFGWLGLKSSRRRGMAMAGLLFSMLAIAMALTIVA